MSLVWYQAAKHCSSSSVAGMVTGNETLQCLPQCRCYARHGSANRTGWASAVIWRQLFILSPSSLMGPYYKTETIFRYFPI
jgi:hypothetical protein